MVALPVGLTHLSQIAFSTHEALCVSIQPISHPVAFNTKLPKTESWAVAHRVSQGHNVFISQTRNW